jgi:hypothetical protein
VVLVDERGGLLEGLVTNFYVVAGGRRVTGGAAGRRPLGDVLPRLLDWQAAARLLVGRRPGASPCRIPAARISLDQCCCAARPAAEAPQSNGGDTGAAPSAPPRAASADLSRFELQTATGAGGEALPGTSQRRVLEAARAMGLRVRAGAPLCEERGTWREAFITNRCVCMGRRSSADLARRAPRDWLQYCLHDGRAGLCGTIAPLLQP